MISQSLTVIFYYYFIIIKPTLIVITTFVMREYIEYYDWYFIAITIESTC